MNKDFYQRLKYRHRLVKLARRAWEAWGEAAEVHQEAVTALVPCEECIEAAIRRCRHHQGRYHRLEALLAEETGSTRSSVYNQISASWPITPMLMANL